MKYLKHGKNEENRPIYELEPGIDDKLIAYFGKTLLTIDDVITVFFNDLRLHGEIKIP